MVNNQQSIRCISRTRDALIGASLVLSLVLLSGCASSPEANMANMAERAGFETGAVAAGEFTLDYFHRGLRPMDSALVNLYLEGDGTPWLRPDRIARNPTPRNPLALGLMQNDPGAAIYLSRPCYFGRHEQPPCGPWFWTHGRYSEQVVNAMAVAIRSIIETQAPNARMRLIGHSGGGVLAVLLAERLESVVEVVTLAANLDIDVWAQVKGYSRLDGSLNPALRDDISARLSVLHLVGGQDRQVPAELTLAASAMHENARMIVIEHFQHHCCWSEHWGYLLDVISDPESACVANRQPELAMVCDAGNAGIP